MKVKFKISDACFYFFWFLLQLGKGLGYTAREREFLYLLIIGAPFVLFRLVRIRWDQKSLINCIVFNLLGVIIALFSGTTTYLLTILCVTAARNMNIEKLAKVSLFVRFPLYIARTTMAILGFVDMQMRYRYEDGVVVAVRYALGYDHPNTTHFELFMLIVLIFVLYRKRLRIAHYIAIFLYNCFISTVFSRIS